MQTSDTGLLFQTATQISDGQNRDTKIHAAEHVGRPIRVTGKVLDFVISGSEAVVAESGWQARRIDLESGKTIRLYKSHTGPVTSVAILRVDSETEKDLRYLITGSWDKTIKIWDLKTAELLHTLHGHTDFVKSILILPHSPWPRLLSTSSDRTIKIWELAALGEGKLPHCVQTIKMHTRPVDCSTLLLTPEQADGMVWTGDSLGVIHKWRTSQVGLAHVGSLSRHETSITSLFPTEEGVWSVSMDKTAIFHAHGQERSIEIPHSSYIHSIISLHHESRSLILTGSDDEDLRLWEEDDEGRYRMTSRIQGHCGAVSAIRTWNGEVITGSLDGTLRRWTVQDLLTPVALNFESKKEVETELTEDEERELAEMME